MESSNKKSSWNSQLVGAIVGIVLPVIAFVIFYYWNIESFQNFEGFKKFLGYADILPKVISLAVIPNLLGFFGFIKMDLLRAARGVLLSTIIIGFIMVIIRFG